MTDLRQVLRAALPLAERLARFSDTTVDDQVVRLLHAVVESDPLWAFLESLLASVPSPVLATATSPSPRRLNGFAHEAEALAAVVPTLDPVVSPSPTVEAAAAASGLPWATVVMLLPALIRLVAALRMLTT